MLSVVVKQHGPPQKYLSRQRATTAAVKQIYPLLPCMIVTIFSRCCIPRPSLALGGSAASIELADPKPTTAECHYGAVVIYFQACSGRK